MEAIAFLLRRLSKAVEAALFTRKSYQDLTKGSFDIDQIEVP